MEIPAPRSLQLEHLELRHFIAKAAHEDGELGEAARLVGRLLEGHTHKEEAFAMPPLSLLAALAAGKLERSMGEILPQAEWLKKNLGELVAEHHAILAALEKLVAAARAANRFDYVEFAEDLMNHARMEEEILYPAAILVGEYLKLRLGAAAGSAAAPARRAG
jgi:regulator of replication initiation timing